MIDLTQLAEARDGFNWIDSKEIAQAVNALLEADLIRWCETGHHVPADIIDEMEWCCLDGELVSVVVVPVETL